MAFYVLRIIFLSSSPVENVIVHSMLTNIISEVWYKNNKFMMYPCLRSGSLFLVMKFHWCRGLMKYPYTKTIHPDLLKRIHHWLVLVKIFIILGIATKFYSNQILALQSPIFDVPYTNLKINYTWWGIITPIMSFTWCENYDPNKVLQLML